MSGKENETYKPDEGTIEFTYSETFNYRDLPTMGSIRTEMVRLYKMVRAKRIDTKDYSRFVNGLKEMGNIIRDSDLEKRLKDLESLVNK
jgi:hypothetical protein